MLEILEGILPYFIDLRFILFVFIGSVAGLFVGAIPGLSVAMATALLVSITYSWGIHDAMATVMGVYVVGVFSGAVSAILIGGASVNKATIMNVIVGTILFQGIVTMTPTVMNNMIHMDMSEVIRIIASMGMILFALTRKTEGSK